MRPNAPLLLLAAFLAAGCERADTTEGDGSRAQGSVPVSRSGTQELGATSPDTVPLAAFQPLESVSIDVNGDGRDERIVLMATMESRDGTAGANDTTAGEAGPPIVEDGHRWLVLLRRDTADVRLFERFVPWGQVRMWVVHEEHDDEPAVSLLVQTTLKHGERVGSAMQKFVFDPRTGGFSRTDSVAAFGAGTYRAPLAAPPDQEGRESPP